jgi:hypothetical protein
MSTLSSVPEEKDAKALLINHIEHSMPELVDRGYAKHLLNEAVNQQIKNVLDEALANSVFKHKHEAEEHVVDYKNGYNDGVEAVEDVIREIRSRYE